MEGERAEEESQQREKDNVAIESQSVYGERA